MKLEIQAARWSVFALLMATLPAMADQCYIYIPHGCQNPAPIGQWFGDDGGGASNNQVLCMQRAADYQAWCGTDFAFASYWRGNQNSNVVDYYGKPLVFSLPAGTGIPLDNLWTNPNGVLAMQGDGNLVSWQNGKPIFATSNMQNYGRTDCAGGCSAQMQWDGNLVLYNGGGPYWSSNTWGNGGARLILYQSTPTLEIVSWDSRVLFTSMTNQSPSLNAVNNQINSGQAYLDYLIQDVCVDAFDHAIPGDPANCGRHRNIRTGEKVPYLITDYDRAFNQRYQALSSYPVMGTDGSLKVMVSKNGERNFDAGFRFYYNQNNDGYDLIDTNSDTVSGIRTSDPGCLDQLIDGGSQRANGWIFFNKNMGSGSQVHTIDLVRISPDRKSECGASGRGQALDVWNPPTPVGFESGKVLNSVITYHYAAPDLSQQNNALERYFFTREYGFTRWEAWQPLSRCVAENGNVDKCHPDFGRDGLAGRCNPGSSVAKWGAQTWVRLDCRDNTFYADINTPFMPFDGTMAQNHGVSDINLGDLFRMW